MKMLWKKKKVMPSSKIDPPGDSPASTKHQTDEVDATKGSAASTKEQTDEVDATKGGAASTNDQTDEVDVTKGGVANVTKGSETSTKPQAATGNGGNSTEINKDDFRTDEGGTPGWNFVEMMEAGKSYLDLPLPRKISPGIRDLGLESMLSEHEKSEISKKRNKAWKLLQYIPPQYISVMAHSDIGIGTDPERSEQHILNKRKQVLNREIFATCLIDPGLHETVQTVHTITEESQKSNGKKIDFGISGGFEGVQFGFEVANDSSDWSHSRRVIAIADLRYQWATVEARIHRENLHKFLTNDCKKALKKINNTGVDPALAFELSRFIGKYGTHVVLKCTLGYRMEKVEKTSVSSADELKTFKVGVMASVLGYAGVDAKYQTDALEADGQTENVLDIKSIGSKEHMKEALDGGMYFEKMMKNCGEEGDAGVISHDWNMMIANMLLEKDSPYKEWAAKRLQYWTRVRINDLKAGWDEGLFATSYELKFVKARRAKKIRDKNVCVMIGGVAVVHNHPGKDTCCVSHVTNVHTNEAKLVRISVLNDELALKKVLSGITVFRRVLQNQGEGKGIESRVLATKIDTSGVNEPEGEWKLFDLGTTANYDSWETKIKDKQWISECKERKEDDISIEKARATVCRKGLKKKETCGLINYKLFGYELWKISWVKH